ncbi:MAG: hypothetical protein ONB48_13770 [candidate division KSB1 bacterium]|nr:hypothetical protein [candidate division KSB1 bacterium]MDZ7276501.1 hypothetical protein [candidate division KSB1 bacterium]MDZ7286718.1 hypothetical protein [candidate division KSB1 bacterium]MDZ7300271.1 hypothetical protein [candidate division KSB1 bacterium]MDZ7309405.1 hypothetical protein [candidate division KSB1 bacterium]
MKPKACLLAIGLTVMSFVISGCYTQLARPDQDDEPDVAVIDENEAGQKEEAAYSKNSDDERDRPGVTNIYIYDYDPWDPWDPWYYSWYYYPYHPRNRFYFSIGWGAFYDYWNWCGTRWVGYWDPWYRDYYSWWGPRPYYHPGWIYYPGSPVYDPPVAGKKREFGRRGSRDSGDDFGGRRGSISQPIADRTNISKPGDTVFDRGADGSYRRQRRSEVDTRERTTPGQGQNTDRRRVSRRSIEDRTTDAVGSPRPTDRTYTAPSTSKSADSVSKPKSSGQRESGTRREGRKSSGDGSSSRRIAPSRESSSSGAPSIHSSGSSSGHSGSPSRDSSSSGSKSSNSGSSNRRSRN